MLSFYKHKSVIHFHKQPQIQAEDSPMLTHLMQDKRRKSLLQDFSLPSSKSYVTQYSKTHNFLKCICQSDDGIGYNCFKCGSYVHNCLERELNRGQLFECAPCINKAMDPIFTVRKVLVESYFKTQSIFEKLNQTTFEFIIGSQDLFYPIEIRALKPGITSLSYPMQGIVQLNNKFIYEFRPLKVNSNRKNRRQQFITIPSDNLRLGQNFIKFRILTLDKDRFKEYYQYEEHALYYMSINSIEQIRKQTLIRQTFAKRRWDKAQSLGLLTEQNGEIEVTQTKLCLICPYTKERIKVPIRGRYCKHFTCICLQTLIASHIRSRYWGCPICDNKISQPFVDVWIYSMLKDNRHGTDVIVQSDGTYDWIDNHQEVLNLDSQDQDSVRAVSHEEVNSILFNPNAKADSRELRKDSISRVVELDSSYEVGASSQAGPIDQDRPLELVDPLKRIEEIKKLINGKLKQKIIKALGRQPQHVVAGQNQEDILAVSRAAITQNSIQVDNEKNRQMQRSGVGMPVIKEVRELRVKQQSYDIFRKKYMLSQLSFAKKTKSFMDQFPNLKHIFKQVIS